MDGKRYWAAFFISAVALTCSSSALGATVSRVFTIDTAVVSDFYSGGFDGPLIPAANFWGGTPPSERAVVFTSFGTGSGTLDIQYDDVTGEILQVNSMIINLPALDMTMLGTTVASIRPGNGFPVANDSASFPSAGMAYSGHFRVVQHRIGHFLATRAA